MLRSPSLLSIAATVMYAGACGLTVASLAVCTPGQRAAAYDARSAAEKACADLAKYGPMLPLVVAPPAAVAVAHAATVDAGVDAAAE